MSVKTTNNAFATLAADIAAVQNVVTVTAGQGGRFPTLSAADYFYATLVNALNQTEIVKVTQRTGDTMTVMRASSPIAFSAGDRFELRPTAELFNDKLDAADAANTYATKTYSDTTYLTKSTGGSVTFLQVTTGSPQIQLNDTATAAPGGRWRLISSGNNALLQRNTAGSGDYSTVTTPVYFRSDDVGVFLKRPIFPGGATPWDTANVTPLDKNLGGVVGGAMQFNSGVTVQGFTQVNNVIQSNNEIRSTNGVLWAYNFAGNGNSGVVYLNAGRDAYHYYDGSNHLINGGGNVYFNGQRMLHVGNGTSDLVNNSGFITSIAVAAPRITGSDSGNGYAITGLELADPRTVRLVGQYLAAPPFNGGQGG
jgi:hypothetical protein